MPELSCIDHTLNLRHIFDMRVNIRRQPLIHGLHSTMRAARIAEHVDMRRPSPAALCAKIVSNSRPNPASSRPNAAR